MKWELLVSVCRGVGQCVCVCVLYNFKCLSFFIINDQWSSSLSRARTHTHISSQWFADHNHFCATNNNCVYTSTTLYISFDFYFFVDSTERAIGLLLLLLLFFLFINCGIIMIFHWNETKWNERKRREGKK